MQKSKAKLNKDKLWKRGVMEIIHHLACNIRKLESECNRLKVEIVKLKLRSLTKDELCTKEECPLYAR